MRLRHLALFALTTSLFVLVGGLAPEYLDAQEKKNKNKKKFDPPAKLDPNEKFAPPVKPPVSTLPVPKTKDAAALAKVIDDAVAKRLAGAKLTESARTTDEEFLRRTYLDIAGTQVIVRTDADQPVQAGETIDLQFRPDRLHLFDGRDDTARAVRLA